MMRVVCVTLLLACFGTNNAIHIGKTAFSEIKSKQGKDNEADEDDHPRRGVDHTHDDDPAGANMHGPISDDPPALKRSQGTIGVEPADPTTRAPTMFPGQPKWFPTTPTTSEVPDLYNPLVATNPEERANLINNLAVPIAKIMIDLAANSPQAKAAGFTPDQLKPFLGDSAVNSAVREGNARTAEGLPSAPDVSMGEDGLPTKYQEPELSKMSAEEAYQHKRDHRQEHLPSKGFKDCPNLDPNCVTEQNAQETELFDRMAKDQEFRSAAAAQSAAEAAKKAEEEVANGKAEKKAMRSAWWKKMQSYWTGGVAAEDDDDGTDSGETAPTEAEAGAADIKRSSGALPVSQEVWDKEDHGHDDPEHDKEVAAAAAAAAHAPPVDHSCDEACRAEHDRIEAQVHGHDHDDDHDH